MIGVRMRRRIGRRWLIGGALAGLLAVGVAAAFAANVLPPRGDADIPGSLFGPRMARAEVVLVVDGAVHAFRIDQGRLQRVGPDAVVIAERDGTMQQVPVAPDARVTLNGAPAPLGALRRGLLVVTVRDGDAPAMIVKARIGLAR